MPYSICLLHQHSGRGAAFWLLELVFSAKGYRHIHVCMCVHPEGDITTITNIYSCILVRILIAFACTHAPEGSAALLAGVTPLQHHRACCLNLSLLTLIHIALPFSLYIYCLKFV